MILQNRQLATSWGPHGRRLLHLLATQGPASRERLHHLSGLHRSLVGDTVRRLMDDGLVRLESPQVRGRGRPRTPVTLDAGRRHVLGVAIDPGQVSACCVNLLGEPLEPARTQRVAGPADPVAIAAEMIRIHAANAPLAIGVSITGVIDVEHSRILESSSTPSRSVSLGSLGAAAGAAPLILDNDLHALAHCWRMQHAACAAEDVLLVRLEDGAVGAALIIQGNSHVGCIHAASELGHTRLAVNTRPCYCGRRGCLERIFDSAFARDADGAALTLSERLASRDALDPALGRVLDLVGAGVANAVQLTKPHRLVVVSSLAGHRQFRRRLLVNVRRALLTSLRRRVHCGWWDGPLHERAAIAAYPALAFLLRAPADVLTPTGD